MLQTMRMILRSQAEPTLAKVDPDGTEDTTVAEKSPQHATHVSRRGESGVRAGDTGGLSAAQSVSRSFSLLRASGARAMLPVKKALGGDPEVVEARECLTKYKAKLALAIADAEATVATRRDERELLTKALASQENDLRCWGYLSVLPFFREHRRQETSRAQLRVTMAERREKVISEKHQEVIQLLRSLPIIGPWTNKQQLPLGITAESGGDGEGGRPGGNNPFISGGHDRFLENAFAVAPADLLAFDEDLASMRQRLVSCDRACAAAADAFAMKVVDAGGLGPRSFEDRVQMLLSLLSRYHVLEKFADEILGSEEMRQPAAVGATSVPKAEVTEEVSGRGVTGNGDDEDAEAAVDTARGGGSACASGREEEGTAELGHDDGRSLVCPASFRFGFSTRSREECEEAFLELMLDERNREGRLLRRFLTMAQAKTSPPSSSSSAKAESLRSLSTGHSSSGAAYAAEVRRPAPRKAAAGSRPNASDAAATGGGAFSWIRRRPRGSGYPTSASNTGAAEVGNNPDACGAGIGAAGTKWGTTADAAPADATASGSGEGECMERKEEEEEKKEEDEDWEGEGSVSPQVVKAFINYFSQEYLVKIFDVPDILVPSLTELVTLLVFRQARRLVFGYDRRRVMASDRAWRDKATKLRSVCLLELGAPPEYVPVTKTNASNVGDTVEAAAMAVTAPVAEDAEAREPDDAAASPKSASTTDEASGAKINPDTTHPAIAVNLPRETGATPPAAPASCGADGRGGSGGGLAHTPALSKGAAAAPTAGDEMDKLDVGYTVPPTAHRIEECPAYGRASREFGRLGECLTPAKMLAVVKAGMMHLSEDSARISGSGKPLDADTLIPLLVHALVHADLPRVHEALNLLRNFRGPSWGGEAAYYVTCIEAAVSFTLDWRPAGTQTDLPLAPDDGAPAENVDNDSGSKVATTKTSQARRSGGSDDGDAAVAARWAAERASEEEEKGREALMRLGIFLEKHEVQEDTVDVLASAGWL